LGEKTKNFAVGSKTCQQTRFITLNHGLKSHSFRANE